jgi:acetyl esterase/lipase
MDYRLLPESTFNEQLEDVKDVESWVRGKLSSELEETGLKADIDKIVVVGASAGAHLALLIVSCPRDQRSL